MPRRSARPTLDSAPPSRGAHPTALLVGGFAAGLLLGVTGWMAFARHHRRDLFAATPSRRYAALSFVRAPPSPENARTLREYVAWEVHPRLRRRALRALRRMERTLAA
jgi:hypothetical protein